MLRSLVLILLFISTNALSGNDLSVQVEYEDPIYSTKISTSIRAEPAVLFSLLTSYEQFHTFSQLIKSSHLLPNGNLHLQIEICFAFICFEKEQVLQLSISNQTIKGTIIPELSDFSYGWLTWTLSNKDSNSHISFHSEIIPDFWVPPFIGPLLIKHKLEREAEYSISKLEELANR